MLTELTERQKNLLREIYSTTVTNGAVLYVTSGFSAGQGYSDLHFSSSIRARLEQAIAEIDINPSSRDRVAEILDEYDGWNLDPSTIDKDGYSFRWQRSMRRILDALTPYTRIVVDHRPGSNLTPLG